MTRVIRIRTWYRQPVSFFLLSRTPSFLNVELVKSQAAIRLELVEAERAAFTAADTQESSPSAFIISGLELEDAQ